MIKAKKSKIQRGAKIQRFKKREISLPLTYLDFGVLLSEHSNAELSTVFTEARMNSRLWLSAYVSEAQVSRMIAPVWEERTRLEVGKREKNQSWISQSLKNAFQLYSRITY